MRNPGSQDGLFTAAALTTAALLFLIACFMLAAPQVWSSFDLVRILGAVATLVGVFLLVAPIVESHRCSPLASPQCPSVPQAQGESAPGQSEFAKPRIISQDLLKTAAEQKKTIEELRATVQELEKQVAGMRLQAGIEVDGQTVYLWSQEYFRRVLEAELWRSRRMQRPLSLLLIEFSDEVTARRGGGGSVDSSVWQYHAETVCRAVRGGDHVGLVQDGTLCVLLTETAPDAAKVAQDRIAKLIDRERQRQQTPVSASVVVDTALVGFPGDGKDLDGLLLAAQKTILRAQRNRRTA